MLSGGRGTKSQRLLELAVLVLAAVVVLIDAQSPVTLLTNVQIAFVKHAHTLHRAVPTWQQHLGLERLARHRTQLKLQHGKLKKN